MLRGNNVRALACLTMLLAVMLTTGCAKYQAKKAFDEAEQLLAEEKFDQAVEKYFEATTEEPGSKTYKLKLMASRTRAAAHHIKKARRFNKEGKTTEALVEYRLARGFDPSLEIAAQEEQALLNQLEADKLVEEAQSYYQQRRLSFANKNVRKALDLDPQNKGALELKGVINKESHTIAMDGIELDVASDEPITLRFQKANIKEVFGILNRLTEINFILDEDVSNQSISVFLEKASFAQAMQLILQMNGLSKKVLNSKTIIIYPQSKNKEKQYEDQIIQTFYLSHIDAKKAVNMLRTMLQLRKIYVHEERNALVIRDKPDVIRLAEQILDAADRENSEVIFDLEIVSVSDGEQLDIGPTLSQYSVGVGFSKDGINIVDDALPADGTTGNLVQSLNRLQTYYSVPSATFDFAKTLTSTEILASPKIRVRNREKAKVHIGTREPIITTTTTDIATSSNIQYVDVGVKVDVEPVIQLNQTIETKLRLEVSQVTDREEVGDPNSPTTALTISTTNAETVLTLKDGVQTILGGLFEQQETNQRDTLPFLGDIPLLGALFTGFSDQDRKREILLSITPYIVKQLELPDIDVATIWSGGEDNLKLGPNFGAFSEPIVSEFESTKPMVAPSLVKATQPGSANAFNPEVKADVPTRVLASSAARPPEIEGSDDGTPVNPNVLKSAESTDKQLATATPESSQAPAEMAADDLPETSPPPEQSVPAMSERRPAQLVFSGPASVTSGREFSLAVEIENVEGLYSAPLFVNYDPAVLELVEVTEGSFLKQDGQNTFFSTRPNRVTGQVVVGYKQGPGGKGASGTGVLFTLTFLPKAIGATEVSVGRINFRGPEGTRVEVSPAVRSIEVL